jgi:hypothetical protein
LVFGEVIHSSSKSSAMRLSWKSNIGVIV